MLMMMMCLYTAVWDSASATWHDDARPVGHRKDVHYPPADEGHDGLRRSSQGDEDEPEGDHRTSDVWSSRRRHQRLDWRHLLCTVETNSQDQERSETKHYSLCCRPLYRYKLVLLGNRLSLRPWRVHCMLAWHHFFLTCVQTSSYFSS